MRTIQDVDCPRINTANQSIKRSEIPPSPHKETFLNSSNWWNFKRKLDIIPNDCACIKMVGKGLGTCQTDFEMYDPLVTCTDAATNLQWLVVCVIRKEKLTIWD